jgi:hypothetical protein
LQKIGDSAFTRTAVECIKIPASVEEIGASCFFNCKDLVSVTFERGSKLQAIGESAFSKVPTGSLKLVRTTGDLKIVSDYFAGSVIQVVSGDGVTSDPRVE